MIDVIEVAEEVAGTILVLCLLIICIALTIKFVWWLF